MRIAALFLVSLALFGVPEQKVEAKLKDVARLQGVRGNPLLGYGVIVGLDGTPAIDGDARLFGGVDEVQ